MTRKTNWARALALIMTVALLASSIVSTAFAADTVHEAKDSLATVDITQVYNNKTVGYAEHDYRTDGEEVKITYSATLKMTEEMAIYLQVRQMQLMRAEFNVNVNMDLDLLEFIGNPETVTVDFTSTFLKPADMNVKGYSYKLTGVKDGVFAYQITVPMSWLQAQATKNGKITIPMELIVLYKNGVAYNYEEAKAYPEETLLYQDFTVAQWMHEIKLSFANMQVKKGVAETITTDRNTWKTVVANGTVDGRFAYIAEPAETIETMIGYEEAWKAEGCPAGKYITELCFGEDPEDVLDQWVSNEVKVLLKRSTKPTKPVGPEMPDSPYLNLDDHFAYIIGYPDGNVKPLGTITRAEVATIFFRMLTDEIRNEYWCQTNPYNDVDLDDWFNNAVSTLTNLGVVNGYPDGGFHPQANITRAEFATMAVRFFIITEDYQYDSDAFTDIANHWANEYINIAYLLGIINGYPDGTYRPANVINRAEAVTIVNNTLRRSPCASGLLPEDKMIMWPDNMNKKMWYYAAVQEATNSHAYGYLADNVGHEEHHDFAPCEQWTEPLPVRDWAAFEKAWSDANSAANPGEVVEREEGVNTLD